jgi:hypothetical protein
MIGAALLACSLFAGLVASPPAHQNGATQKRLLRVLLADMERKTGIRVVAVAALGGEAVQSPAIEDVDLKNLEEQLRAVVAKLPIPARLIKLNLPKGPAWTADELLTYAKAEAALFRRPIQDAKPDILDILGQPYAKEKAQPAIDALELRPVYVIALRNSFFGGTWHTTYGEMHLEQRGNRVTGTYSTNSGIIEGVIVGDELRASWFEQSNGTGGTAFFKLSEDGMSFAGPWYNSTDWNNQAGIWTGQRQGKITPTKGEPPPTKD